MVKSSCKLRERKTLVLVDHPDQVAQESTNSSPISRRVVPSRRLFLSYEGSLLAMENGVLVSSNAMPEICFCIGQL